MKTRHLLIAAVLAGAFAPALAWQGGAPPAMEAMELAAGAARGPGPHFMEHFGPALMHGGARKSVKNAPYSAEAVNEYQHNLADGNQIVSRRSSMSYRDSAGRMRHEVRDEQGVVRHVTIIDPNEGSTWMLRPESKTAVKIGRRVERDAEREARRKLRDDMHSNGTGRGEEIRIRIDKDMAARAMPMPGMERLGPAIARAFGDIKYAAKGTVKDLGTREIEGVKAQGKLRSYEIPAGDIGNRNPIVVSDERWYAPELQVTVLTRHSDPRSGERTYRLSNIRREEPAAALFAIPSDYTVKDSMAALRKAPEARK